VSDGKGRLGRAATVAALVEAARKLFVARGPSAVSLRDVAREAGVNHALIHHYIGSRDDLLRLVFAESTARAKQQVEGTESPTAALAALRRLSGNDDAYSRLLAWALLEGRDPAEFHGRSAAMEAVIGTTESNSRELRIAVAMATAYTLGWKLFGDYALKAVGLTEEDPVAIRAETEAVIDQIVDDAAAGRGLNTVEVRA
jgi:AcrR family transcriptional regulator